MNTPTTALTATAIAVSIKQCWILAITETRKLLTYGVTIGASAVAGAMKKYNVQRNIGQIVLCQSAQSTKTIRSGIKSTGENCRLAPQLLTLNKEQWKPVWTRNLIGERFSPLDLVLTDLRFREDYTKPLAAPPPISPAKALSARCTRPDVLLLPSPSMEGHSRPTMSSQLSSLPDCLTPTEASTRYTTT